MAKYSTGGSSGSGDASACELCGATSDSLRTANVAGATLDVCPNCRPHDDAAHKDKKKRTKQRGNRSGGSGGSTGANTSSSTSNSQPSGTSMWDGDTTHWEEGGTDYEDDRLPYLVPNYGERVEVARQDAGYQRDELAEEIGVPEADLLAVEQGRATQAGIGGSVIEALEETLDVTLADE